MMYEQMKNAKERIMLEIAFVEEQLKDLPKGKLICAKNGNGIKWYESDGHCHTYISKKQRSYAEKLAAKRFLDTRKRTLEQEKLAIDMYLRHYQGSSSMYRLLEETSPFHELLSQYFQTSSAQMLKWQSEDYPTNPNFPEHLTQKTISGIYVRSKSEAMIATLLHTNRIPFRYECLLELNGIKMYPDFTIMHPQTRQIMYWEHFGLLDSNEYVDNMLSKLKLYISNGIVPSVNLILTYETQEHPLQMAYIDELIRQYFVG